MKEAETILVIGTCMFLVVVYCLLEDRGRMGGERTKEKRKRGERQRMGDGEPVGPFGYAYTRASLLGAGPVGVELAAEVLVKYPNKTVTLCDYQDTVCGSFPEKTRVYVEKW